MSFPKVVDRLLRQEGLQPSKCNVLVQRLDRKNRSDISDVARLFFEEFSSRAEPERHVELKADWKRQLKQPETVRSILFQCQEPYTCNTLTSFLDRKRKRHLRNVFGRNLNTIHLKIYFLKKKYIRRLAYGCDEGR